MSYNVVPAAYILTVRDTALYQMVCDYLAADRDQGRWTTLLSIHEHAASFAQDDEGPMTLDRLKAVMANLVKWGAVLSDNDHTGVRSLKDITHARLRYQLTATGSAVLRFRDELSGPETGNLDEERPRFIAERIHALVTWVDTNAGATSLSTEALKDLSSNWTQISDALSGMQEDADKFLGRVERRVRDLASDTEVAEGDTHPLIEFRGWFRSYTHTFVREVQELGTYGYSALSQMRDLCEERTGDANWIRSALIAAEDQLKPNIAAESESSMHADRILSRLENLVARDGTCNVLANRAHGAWDRYLAAVNRIRIRMGDVAGRGRARMYSALASKIAHVDDLQALRIASVVIPERFNARILALPDFAMTKPGRDAWTQPADWKVPLPGVIRGNPSMVATSAVRQPSETREAKMRDRAEADRREAAFWIELLATGGANMGQRVLSAEEALWLHQAMVKGRVSGDRTFRLRSGARVAISRDPDPEAVSELVVVETGIQYLPAFHLEAK